MNQLDWVSASPTAKPFRDIRGTRPSVAEQKAELALELGRFTNSIPESVRNGSVDCVRRWRTARDAAAKVVGNRRASVQDLTAAISRMRDFE